MKLGTVSLQKMKSEVIRVLPADNISEDAPVVQKCFYCSTDQEIILCNWCRQVYFCRKHQSIHRSRSKCFPFVVCRSEHDGPLNGHGLGGGRRKLLASRDIRAGKNFLNYSLDPNKHPGQSLHFKSGYEGYDSYPGKNLRTRGFFSDFRIFFQFDN